jgi:hypothetical protein
MTDDGDLPIGFYRERHASKNRAGNFLAVTTLGTVLLLLPVQNFVSPGALRDAPLTFGKLSRLLLSTRYSKFIGMSAYVEYGQVHAFQKQSSCSI